ncbi:MAG: hypothetical protein MAG451_01822 [Anaerolineales bacterium]|nr:hypothetical protein [Anaerolineales bacterium]
MNINLSPLHLRTPAPPLLCPPPSATSLPYSA